jgi:hypothetical protein
MNTHHEINLIQTRWDCFIDKCSEKASIRKGKKCKRGKLSKERLRVIFCSSATGEKLKHLVTAPHPHAFKEHLIDTKQRHG